MKPETPLTADGINDLRHMSLTEQDALNSTAIGRRAFREMLKMEALIAALRTQLEQAQNAYYEEVIQRDALLEALRNQGLLQNTASGAVWHVHDCPASFDFNECNYRCRVAREAFALAGTEPYVSQETRRDIEVYE